MFLGVNFETSLKNLEKCKIDRMLSTFIMSNIGFVDIHIFNEAHHINQKQYFSVFPLPCCSQTGQIRETVIYHLRVILTARH